MIKVNPVKVDNARKAKSAKVEVRRKVLEAIDGATHVFDAFAGRGEYFKSVWRDATSYTGCDKRYFPDERRAFVADNRRVLRAVDLDAFNIFDLDAYGSPWEQAVIIAARRKLKEGERVGMVFTEGDGLKYRMNGVPNAVTQLIGLRSGIAGLNHQRDKILAALVTEIARRMGGEIVKRWQAQGRTGHVFPVLPALRIDLAVDRLDFGRVAVRIVATAERRIIRHVPRRIKPLVQKLILSGMVAMSGLVLLTFLRMDERCQQAKSAREEELAKKVQGAVSLLTTAKWCAISG